MVTVRTVIQPLSTLVLLLSQFYCILCIITLWFGLRVLSWTNNQLNWCIHTHMSTPDYSTIHMCTLIISSVLSFIECGHFGWLGALEVDLSQFWIILEHLMPPIASHSYYFACPRLQRSYDCSNSLHTHQHINSWPFGMIWSKFGPPRGDWGQFGQFHMYSNFGIPKPHEPFHM